MMKTKQRSSLTRLLSAVTALGSAAVMLPALPLTHAAAAVYDLSIGGVVVTDANASDVLGDGVFSYDAGTNVLTVTGSIESEGSCIVSYINGLTVNIAAGSALRSYEGAAMDLNGDTTISGDSFLNVRADEGCGICCTGNLTFSLARVSVSGKYGLSGDGTEASSLTVTNSGLTVSGSSEGGAVTDFTGGITYDDTSYLSVLEWYGWGQGDSYCHNGTVYDYYTEYDDEVDCRIAENVRFGEISDYNFRVAGVPVTSLNADDILGDGVFTYYSSRYLEDKDGNGYYEYNTLHVNGDCSVENDRIIDTDDYGMTIAVDSDSVFTVSGDADSAIRINSNTTITGPGKLTIESDNYGIYQTCYCDLYLSNADIDISSVNDCLKGESGWIVIEYSDVSLNSEEGHAAAGFSNGLDLSDSYFSEPAGARALDGTIFCNSVPCKSCAIVADIRYDLWICGTQVVDSISADILGDDVFSYDPESNTLTISGTFFSDSTEFQYNHDDNVIYNMTDDLTIYVDTDSQITTYRGFLYSCNDVTITGPGKLTVSTPQSGSYYTRIEMRGGSLTIRDADIEIIDNADENGNTCTGICGDYWGEDKLTVINSTLRMAMQSTAICQFNGGIVLQDCWFYTPAEPVIGWTLYESDGESHADHVLILPAPEPKITQQPQNTSAAFSDTTQIKVSTVGDNLTYQWQYYKTATKKWTAVADSSAQSAALTLTASADNDNMKYRCIVTLPNGREIISDPAVLTVLPKITAQPANYTGAIGTTAKFTVEASGARALSYQWQNYTSSGWKDSGLASAKTAELSVPVTAARDGFKYRCVISSANGTSAVSMTVTLKAKAAITAQPVSVTQAIGTTAKFTVEATGVNLTYQWQNYTSSGWKNSGLATAKTAELSVPVTAARDGYKYRCIVTSSNGTQATSAAAVLRVQTAIKTQPKNVTDIIGATAKFTVAATGAGTLRYQWQCDTGKGFKDSTASGAKTATLSIPVTAARNGYKYRCIVTSTNGTQATSGTASLKVKTAITAQPVSVTQAIGTTAKFTVTASGAGTLSYQWQNYTSSGWKDSGLASAKTAELTVPVTAARNGYKYRCIVTSSNGTKATSVAATLKVQTAITAQPQNYAGAVGTKAKFTVEATGAGELSYQWQNYTSNGWKDSGLATTKTAELTVPVTEARNGYKYRCIVTSSNGTKATSNAATLTVE